MTIDLHLYLQAGMQSPCIKCTQIGQDQVVECFLCKNMCHIKCNKIPKTVFNYCDKNDLNELGYKWICEQCTTTYGSPLPINFMENINNKLSELENIKKHLDNLENRFNTKVQTYADAVNTNLEKYTENNKIIHEIEKNLTSVRENIETKIDQDEETKAKKRKEKNVILFNIPEEKTDDDAEDFKQDLSKIRSLFENRVIIEKEDVKAVFRIGTYQADSANPRPILMKLKSIEKKNELLKLRNLNFIDKNKLVHKIYINLYRTKKEQEQHKKLIELLKTKRADNPGKSFTIRNNNVIELTTPFRMDPQKFWG